MDVPSGTPRRVLVRDLLIFQLKLLLDGLKDLFLAQLALWAAIVDFCLPRRVRGRLFYGLLQRSERFDLWLNLYRPASQAQHTGDGLFGASRAGANTLLGELEAVVRQKVEVAGRSDWAQRAAQAARRK